MICVKKNLVFKKLRDFYFRKNLRLLSDGPGLVMKAGLVADTEKKIIVQNTFFIIERFNIDSIYTSTKVLINYNRGGGY
jgi:hypothetical protein